MRSVIVGIAAIFLAFLGLFAVLVVDSRIPSDRQVQDRFNRDKPALTELLGILSGEPSKIVGVTQHEVMLYDFPNWVPPDKAGFSDEHFAEYKALMGKAHVIELFRSDGEVNFGFAYWGMAGSGWRLDFAYITTPPSPLVTSIDSPPTTYSDANYRPLGGDWYIRLIFE
jgi:hypothetical protein